MCVCVYVYFIKDLDSFTGIHLDPECAEKFHTPELDYLGIGPPSPRFRTRRVNSPKTSEETGILSSGNISRFKRKIKCA